MLQDGLQKVEDGHSTVEEILKLIELDDDNLNKKSKDSELRAQLEASKKTKDNDSVKEELSGKDLKIEMPVKKQVEEEPVSDTLTLNDNSEESLSIEEPESLSIEEPESLSFGEEIEKLEF